MGHSKGGLTTRIHAFVDADGRPIRLGLTAGQANDCLPALDLLIDLECGTILLADKAYDTEAIRSFADKKLVFNKWLYRQRNIVERFFNRLKQFRGIATRYDRKSENFLAAIKMAAVRIIIKTNESTA